MPSTISGLLSEWLIPGSIRGIAEVAVWNTGPAYRMCHQDDLTQFGPASEGTPTHTEAVEARQLAKLDAGGKFRPLKSAPSLQTGWLLELQTIAEVREALDYFYPAALGLWLRKHDGALTSTDLRETLNRQTGMYRVTALLKDDEARHLVHTACAPTHCGRKILWDIDDAVPLDLSSEKRLEEAADQHQIPDRIPLLCREPCNLLVAAARGVVKKRMSRDG